jgi:phenylalanyl-tRNA synthetase alpha subunit
LVKVLDGDTVVVMTVQQGKDMNKKFLMFKEDIKAANKKIDTLTEANSFLTDYSNAIYIKNKDYEGSLKLLSEKSEKLILKSKSLEDTIKAMNDRLNFERIKVDLTKAETQGKFDLYKTTMEMRVEDYKYKLDREERRTKYVSTRSFIEGGLIVAVLGIAADMVHTYYFKK